VSLDQACVALADFRVEEALRLVERARSEGPYRRQDYLRLHEVRGIAYAYLDRRETALEAFDLLLTLDPGHALSYTLSPKVTFVFEQARKIAASRQPPTVDWSWPRNLRVSDAIPVELEVVSDPRRYLKQATLYSRLKGRTGYSETRLSLALPGRYHRVVLPPIAARSGQAETLQLYLVIRDVQGNEVLELGDAAHPREIPLSYVRPEPWYRKWWVWAMVGTVVAVGTGTTTYLLLRSSPEQVKGSFESR